MLIYNPSAQVAQALVWEEIRKKKTMKRTDIQLWARSSDEYHTCSAAINNYESESESRSVVSDSLRPMECIVHGILQARILEWAAFPFSRRSSQPRNRTQVSCIAGGFFTGWATKSTKQLLSRISQQIFRVWFLQESKHTQWALSLKLHVSFSLCVGVTHADADGDPGPQTGHTCHPPGAPVSASCKQQAPNKDPETDAGCDLAVPFPVPPSQLRSRPQAQLPVHQGVLPQLQELRKDGSGRKLAKPHPGFPWPFPSPAVRGDRCAEGRGQELTWGPGGVFQSPLPHSATVPQTWSYSQMKILLKY